MLGAPDRLTTEGIALALSTGDAGFEERLAVPLGSVCDDTEGEDAEDSPTLLARAD